RPRRCAAPDGATSYCMKRLLVCLTLIACGGSTDIPVSTVGLPLAFCGANAPVWMAYQNDAGPWTRVVADANGVVHVPIDTRGGIAALRGSSVSGFDLAVEYATATELAAHYVTCPPSAG